MPTAIVNSCFISLGNEQSVKRFRITFGKVYLLEGTVATLYYLAAAARKHMDAHVHVCCFPLRS